MGFAFEAVRYWSVIKIMHRANHGFSSLFFMYSSTCQSERIRRSWSILCDLNRCKLRRCHFLNCSSQSVHSPSLRPWTTPIGLDLFLDDFPVGTHIRNVHICTVKSHLRRRFADVSQNFLCVELCMKIVYIWRLWQYNVSIAFEILIKMNVVDFDQSINHSRNYHYLLCPERIESLEI